MLDKLSKLGKHAWIHAYVNTRRAWLANSPRSDLRKTSYPMDAFSRFIDLGAWGLNLPVVLRGTEVSQTTLCGLPPGCYDAPSPGSRPLDLHQPLTRGLDVRLLPLGLSELDAPVVAEGVFATAA